MSLLSKVDLRRRPVAHQEQDHDPEGQSRSQAFHDGQVVPGIPKLLPNRLGSFSNSTFGRFEIKSNNCTVVVGVGVGAGVSVWWTSLPVAQIGLNFVLRRAAC